MDTELTVASVAAELSVTRPAARKLLEKYQAEYFGNGHFEGDRKARLPAKWWRAPTSEERVEKPRPRPGRDAFHSSIVSGSQPRTPGLSPITASAGGRAYRASVSGATPMRSANCLRDRYNLACSPGGHVPGAEGNQGSHHGLP
jgi:hypothetical protein